MKSFGRESRGGKLKSFEREFRDVIGKLESPGRETCASEQRYIGHESLFSVECGKSKSWTRNLSIGKLKSSGREFCSKDTVN